MAEVQRIIYEYRMEKVSGSNVLFVMPTKVDVLPKTYRRVGRGNWHSYTRVWFKTDEGKLDASSHVYFTERNDKGALEVFKEKILKDMSIYERCLNKSKESYESLSKIKTAIEDEES